MALTIGTLLSSQTTTAHLVERSAPVRGNSQDIIDALGACQLGSGGRDPRADLRGSAITRVPRGHSVCPTDTPKSDEESVVNP